MYCRSSWWLMLNLKSRGLPTVTCTRLVARGGCGGKNRTKTKGQLRTRPRTGGTKRSQKGETGGDIELTASGLDDCSHRQKSKSWALFWLEGGVRSARSFVRERERHGNLGRRGGEGGNIPGHGDTLSWSLDLWISRTRMAEG